MGILENGKVKVEIGNSKLETRNSSRPIVSRSRTEGFLQALGFYSSQIIPIVFAKRFFAFDRERTRG